MRLDSKMVQVPSYPPTKEGWQQQTRQHDDYSARYSHPMRVSTTTSAHDRLLTITQAIKSCAGVPVKEYALVAILDSGEERLFCSKPQAKINIEPVIHELRRAAALGSDLQHPTVAREGVWSTNPVDLETSFGSQYHSGSENRRRRHESNAKSEESDEEGSRRKRSKNRRRSHTSSTQINTARTQQLRIGDSERLAEFYAGRWRDLQQTACKTVGKAFVKLIEPKKQTHHPYTKGDAFAPDWWPSCTGENATRHKEPDHLYKRERVRLCDHILSLVVQPNHKQMECFRHLNLNVRKLEEFTMEQMNPWFTNPNHPKNKEKKKYLKEIFKVAKQQERYLDGQIDANTYVNVMFGQDFRRNAVDYSTCSDSDDGSDTEANDDTIQPKRRRSPTSNLVVQTQPEYIASHPHPHQAQHYDVGPIYEQPRTFGAPNPMTIEHDRRSFGSSPAYSQGSNSYAWTPSPASSMGNTPPSTFFTTSPQIANPMTGVYQMEQAPPMPTTLPPLQHNFDAAPRYDMNGMAPHQEPLRQENMNIPHVNTSFADNMFAGAHYAPQHNEPVYHTQH